MVGFALLRGPSIQHPDTDNLPLTYSARGRLIKPKDSQLKSVCPSTLNVLPVRVFLVSSEVRSQ